MSLPQVCRRRHDFSRRVRIGAIGYSRYADGHEGKFTSGIVSTRLGTLKGSKV
jgi:hypothetical protein